jgi:hypothetical protein
MGRLANSKAALEQLAVVHGQAAHRLLRVFHEELGGRGDNRAGIAHLPASFTLKRRRARHHVHRVTCIGRVDELAAYH